MASQHRVERGECLSSIANRYGFRDYKVIYDDPNNREFKKTRPDPNVIAAGDILYIPDKKDDGRQVTIATDRKHRFVVEMPSCLLRILVKDEADEAIGGKKYALAVGDRVLRGTTTGQGIVEQRAPPTATRATLTVFATDDEDEGECFLWDIAIGHLDPIESTAGVKARLNNLGYYGGEPDQAVDEQTHAALATFQRDQGLKVTGMPDAETRRKLVEIHGNS